MTAGLRDAQEAARLAINEAAPLCRHPVEAHALSYARDAFGRGDFAEAIREAINAAYVAGMGREVRERNKSQGNRPRLADYRAEVERLAAMRRVPAGAYAALAARFRHRTEEAIKRAVMRARQRVTK